MIEHEHEWRPLREVRAPVGQSPGHTVFSVLICAPPCPMFDVFPRTNYALANADWREVFLAGMAALGFRLIDRSLERRRTTVLTPGMIRQLRADVAAGATHDCGEWVEGGACALCDRPATTCPRCGRTSWNPHDIEQRYCGACHRFYDEGRP